VWLGRWGVSQRLPGGLWAEPTPGPSRWRRTFVVAREPVRDSQQPRLVGCFRKHPGTDPLAPRDAGRAGNGPVGLRTRAKGALCPTIAVSGGRDEEGGCALPGCLPVRPATAEHVDRRAGRRGDDKRFPPAAYRRNKSVFFRRRSAMDAEDRARAGRKKSSQRRRLLTIVITGDEEPSVLDLPSRQLRTGSRPSAPETDVSVATGTAGLLEGPLCSYLEAQA
jgi:hypothetical protein